ncbi:hypothetical protein ABI003_15020, partial [Enterococcus faecium]|uniref:hypothetical protein n=1 Tax=Enterococcus faecium TaxID=1352 RepID=UPI003F444332
TLHHHPTTIRFLALAFPAHFRQHTLLHQTLAVLVKGRAAFAKMFYTSGQSSNLGTNMTIIKSYAAPQAGAELELYEFDAGELAPEDVEV